MRWPVRTPRPARPKYQLVQGYWFAWYPVKTNAYHERPKQWVWLERVWYQKDWHGDMFGWGIMIKHVGYCALKPGTNDWDGGIELPDAAFR